MPHNRDKNWDNPWLSISTDDLNNAIVYLKEIGVDSASIETFGQSSPTGEPIAGVTFKDPDGVDY